MSSPEVDYESLEESESGKGSTCSNASNNTMAIDLIGHDSVPVTQIANIAGSKHIHIGTEYSYQAPVNIYVDVMHLHDKLKNVQKITNKTEISADENFVPDDETFVRKFWKKKSNRFILLGSVICIIIAIVLAVVFTQLKSDDDQHKTTEPPFSDLTTTFEDKPTTTSEPEPEVPTSSSISTTKSSTPSPPPTTTTKETTTTSEETTTTPEETTTENPSIPVDIEIVSRDDWGAKFIDPIKRTQLEFPVKTIIIGDIPENSNCTTKLNCMETVQELQALHLKRGKKDIIFNFLIAEDGTVFEGTGWEYQGEHTFGDITTYHERSIGIFYLGNYSGSKNVTDNQIEATMVLINNGTEDGKVHKDYVIYNKYQLEGGVDRYSILNVNTTKLSGYEQAVQLYSRTDWGTRYSLLITRLKERKRVVISHIPEAEQCSDLPSCRDEMELLYIMDKCELIKDIRYNFVVAEKGMIFEGRGWDFPGLLDNLSTDDESLQLINIGFIGSFEETTPDNVSLKAVDQLLNQGEKLEKLADNYAIYGHSQIHPGTLSPGKALFKYIRETWKGRWEEFFIN